MTSEQQLLTISETAEKLIVSVRFIRRLVAERRIPYIKVGKYVRFDQADLESWLDDQRIVEPTPRTTSKSYG